MDSGESSLGVGEQRQEACQLNGKSPRAQGIVIRTEGGPRGVLDTKKAISALRVSISTSVKWVDSVTSSSSNTVFAKQSFNFFFLIFPM